MSYTIFITGTMTRPTEERHQVMRELQSGIVELIERHGDSVSTFRFDGDGNTVHSADFAEAQGQKLAAKKPAKRPAKKPAKKVAPKTLTPKAPTR